MPSAIVLGATGILGREIVNALGRDPKTWPSVHALSRSQKDTYPSNITHAHLDLSAPATSMAEQLQGIEATHLFYAAYVEKESEQDAWDVNGDMLENLLAALDLTGAASKIQRIVLVTGAKQYGVHLGVTKNPMSESDPRLTGDDRPPNFYYRQQDSVISFCEKHTGASWVVTYPNDVIGFAKGNFMNLATSLALYAAVSAEMGARDAGLVFPGSPTFYTRFDSFTSSTLHADFCIWAALEPKAGNQAFNMVNGDVESWQNLFPQLAARFGLKVRPDQFAVDLEKTEGASVKSMADRPPLGDNKTELGLVGGEAAEKASKLEARVDAVQWSQREDVKAAWKKLAEREGLQEDAFGKATWAFLAFVLGRNFDMVISMSKARALGWTGYQDTWSALSTVLDQLEEDKVIPKRR